MHGRHWTYVTFPVACSSVSRNILTPTPLIWIRQLISHLVIQKWFTSPTHPFKSSRVAPRFVVTLGAGAAGFSHKASISLLHRKLAKTQHKHLFPLGTVQYLFVQDHAFPCQQLSAAAVCYNSMALFTHAVECLASIAILCIHY